MKAINFKIRAKVEVKGHLDYGSLRKGVYLVLAVCRKCNSVRLFTVKGIEYLTYFFEFMLHRGKPIKSFAPSPADGLKTGFSSLLGLCTF